LELREKLKEYSQSNSLFRVTQLHSDLLRLRHDLDDAVLLYAQICKLPKADPGNLELFRDWLDHEEGGHLFLQGREAWTWDPPYTEDIMSISGGSTNKDILSQWISGRFIPRYHRKLGHRLNVRGFPRRAIFPWEGVKVSL